MLYELKIYDGAKNLFKNFFSFLVIYLFAILVGGGIISVMMKDLLYGYGSESSFLSLVILVTIITFLLAFLSYKFTKAFFYELARVSKQKYFHLYFLDFFIGLCTIFLLGLGALFILASFILQLIGWIHFKEFAKEESKELQNQTSNPFMYVSLKLIKILTSFFCFRVIVALYYPLYYSNILFMSDFYEYSSNLSVIFPYLPETIFILALISIILLCQKLKSHKILVPFILWHIVIMLFSYTVFSLMILNHFLI